MEPKKDSIDIVIPVMNEAQNVAELCRRIAHAFLHTKWSYRMLFVVDTSTDGTFELLEKLTKKYPLEVFKKRGRPGKAFSIIEGVGYSNTEYVVMIDGDLQYPTKVKLHTNPHPRVKGITTDIPMLPATGSDYAQAFANVFVWILVHVIL